MAQAAATKWAVQAPDGKVIQFPDEFTDADVNREMGKLYPPPQSTFSRIFSPRSVPESGNVGPDAKNHPMPGSFEGHPENIGEYIPASAGEIAGGAADISRGDVSKGAHRIISGAGNAMLPALPFFAAGAPMATALAAGGGTVGGYGARKGAEALGASPDQADLAGDIGGLAGSFFGAKSPGLARSATAKIGEIVRDPVSGKVKTPYELAVDRIAPDPYAPSATPARPIPKGTNYGQYLENQRLAAKNVPPPEPAPLGSPENPGFYAKLPTRMPKPTATAPIKTSPFGNATPSNALNADIPIPQAGAYSPPSANVPGLTRSPYAPPESAPTVEPSRASVVRLPEPREPLPGENPNYNASIPRARLLDLGRQGRPGAGDQLRNIGKTVLYVPPEGYPGPRSAYDPPDAQYSRAGGAEGPYAPPDYAYRAHDAGNYDIDLGSHAHATESAAEAQTYAQSRNAGTPQQVSKINLGKVGPQGYEVREGPNGKKWYKFKRPLTQEDYEQ